MVYDYIIVGQGLAGSVLSYTFIKKGLKVLVLDDEKKDSSSRVAAGIFNPITGKRMLKTWKASLLFPFLNEFYAEMEKDLDARFYFPRPVYKPFASVEEQNHWMSQPDNDQSLVNTSPDHTQYSGKIRNEKGGFETRFSGYVDVPLLLDRMREFLKAHGSYSGSGMEHHQVEFGEEKVIWNGNSARKLIFCEGFGMMSNPFFRWLPMSPAKGEILILRIKDYGVKNIVNKGVFILPVENEMCKVGATYRREFSDNAITEDARIELEEKLSGLLKVPYSVTAQQAGIRPAVKDRRPLIGMHPEFKTLAVFNGLGTKGVSLAPYFASSFYDFLEKKKELDPEVNIQRFYSLYYTLN